MNQDEQNLNLLSIFHYILGALTVLLSSAFLFHVGLGISILVSKREPPFMGLFLILIGSFALLCGWGLGVLMIVAGKKIKMRSSRIFCLVIAGIECTITPFGTVLGVLTIVTLAKEPVIQLFNTGQVQNHQPDNGGLNDIERV